MAHKKLNSKYTGERLVPGSRILEPSRIENLARFKFFREFVHGQWVLDLGCGSGEGSGYLSESPGLIVVGVDLSLDALVTARKSNQNKGASFAQMNVEHLAFPENSMDAILSIEVIEHIPNPTIYLQEAKRILKPGGVFCLTTPNQLRSSPRDELLWPEHLKEYSPGQLLDLLHSFFPHVDLWGESIPIYESHPIRKLVRRLAPTIKPILPAWLRIRALHILQTAIKPHIEFENISFSKDNIEELPTLVALCQN